MKNENVDWFRRKDNLMFKLLNARTLFGVDKYDIDSNIVGVAPDPIDLIRNGDLVECHVDGYKSKIVFIYSNETRTLSQFVTKIWTLDKHGNYLLQWEKEK